MPGSGAMLEKLITRISFHWNLYKLITRSKTTNKVETILILHSRV